MNVDRLRIVNDIAPVPGGELQDVTMTYADGSTERRHIAVCGLCPMVHFSALTPRGALIGLSQHQRNVHIKPGTSLR